MAAMADTKDFDVIRICRSDGADTGPGYWPVTAPPTGAAKKASTEKAPRQKPQMARLSEDDPRFAEWKVKLGILLKQELSPNPEGKSCVIPVGSKKKAILTFNAQRGQSLVRSIPQRILVVREVQTSLGLRIPYQGQAV